MSSEVLVETFEEGELISSYVGTTGPHNKKLADLGLHCYLKMLLKDNFIHADLVRMHESQSLLGGLRLRLRLRLRLCCLQLMPLQPVHTPLAWIPAGWCLHACLHQS